MAQADLPAVLAALKSDGDFEVINAAGATGELQGTHNPEPATVGLIGVGLAGLWTLHRRRALRPNPSL